MVTGRPHSVAHQRGRESSGVRYRQKTGNRSRRMYSASRVAPSITTPRTPRAFIATADSSPKCADTSSFDFTTRTASRGTEPSSVRNARIARSGSGFRVGRPAAGNARPATRVPGVSPTMSWGSVWVLRPRWSSTSVIAAT